MQEITGELYEHYFKLSLLAYVKMALDGTRKLARSLMSPDKESWPLLLIRYFGIWVPFFTDHNPQDYINAVRRGHKRPDEDD